LGTIDYAINMESLNGEPTSFIVEKGQRSIEIARSLKDKGLFSQSWPFLISMFFNNGFGKIKAGEYSLSPHMTIHTFVKNMVHGMQVIRSITIPEGLNVYQIIDILNNELALSGTVDEIPPEGSLLPDTYFFSKGDLRKSIIRRMENNMVKTLHQLWHNRKHNTHITTPYEAIILASIIEKETSLSRERDRIAKVFLNRLAISMPLQADPTIQYFITKGGAVKLGRALTLTDLRIKSPYNTYMEKGLPPTPISCPGKASLKAVLINNSPHTGEFYFVVDGSGGHVFSKHFNAHTSNVRSWRKLQKKMKSKK
jgi:UPF0755 protein